ncbi:MAG: zinc ribbon domain-containing protein [Deltaproteobacteria bacterium]|jgi:putative FmdB family regulatory protein|nr:zinc ribbon domain-containing protein [Deltaproteobacteria bacterium]
MPIYEYECKKCNKIIEHMQKISDPNLETCPECGGEVQKLISHSSFHLKGNGWYVTDYAGRKSGTQAASEAPVPAKKDETSSSVPACSCGSSASGSPCSTAG